MMPELIEKLRAMTPRERGEFVRRLELTAWQIRRGYEVQDWPAGSMAPSGPAEMPGHPPHPPGWVEYEHRRRRKRI